jgi:membrane-bound serine protease (ClpP class)
MAPNTNLGAASPVFMGGGVADSTLNHKVMNDAAAFIETLARERGRNAEWDVRAVREAIATNEKEAVALHIVDFVARDIDEVLHQSDGRTVTVDGRPITLRLAGATVNRITPSWRIGLLSKITDPTVAYVLFNLGSLGLVFELSNPGAILPGIAGAICIVLALIAFQTLPVNMGGLILLVLAMAFFLIELKVHSHGMLAVGGVVSFFTGSLLLFNPALGPAFRVSLSTIGATTAGMALFFLFAIGAGVRAQRRKPTTGAEGLRGAHGVALSAIDAAHAGQVRVRGEIWEALAAPGAGAIAADQAVEVVRIEGLTARVVPLRQS